MKIGKIIKAFMFSVLLTVLFAVTCFVSSAEYREETFTAINYNDDETVITVQYGDSFEFTGEVIDPEIKVYAGSGASKKLLEYDRDYYVEFESDDYWNTELLYPGDYTAYFYLEDYYDYDIEADISVYYSEEKLSVGDIPSKTYNGKVYNPEIKVYYADTLLDNRFYYADYDYSLDAGTYEVIIEMDEEFGYYEMSTEYKIKQASADKTVIEEIKAQTYCGEEICPEPVITFNTEKLSEYWDYSLTYKNNVNAGTGTVTIKFKGNFKGTKTLNFEIKKLSASKVNVYPIDTQDYTGKAIKPSIYAEVGWTDLYQGEDFTVSYSNNVNVGTAKAKLKFKNDNISGSKTVEFQIAVGAIQMEDSYAGENSVELSWWCWNDYSYKVYKYDSAKKGYVYLKSTKNTYFSDKDVKEFKTYKYKVRAYVKIDGKVYNGPYSYVTVEVKLFAPSNVKLKVAKGKNTVSWDKKSNVNGYYVYRYDSSKGTSKKIYTATSKKTTKYVDESVKNYRDYTYWVVAYKKDGDKTIKSPTSRYVGNLDPEVIANCVTLKPKTSYKVYNTQGKKTYLVRTITLSKSDIKTLDNFAKKHFKKGWTNYEKVSYTLMWIHDNVTYASSSKNWNKISGKSYVDAIFNYKLGQCAQYNGALAGMMTHLGYDVQLIVGYRYYNSQHFWTECKINGLTYVMECGNKKDGGWHYTFAPYSYTNGYTKNGKMMS